MASISLFVPEAIVTDMQKDGRPNELIDIRFQLGSDVAGLGIHAALRRPTYLETSAWLEHIPFALWIVDALKPRVLVELGTHLGASYFAFCQSVAESFLDAKCYAVDTWRGDEHAGYYEEGVYEKVRDFNNHQYSSFSQLLRMSFDRASTYFADGSIDLLHIDGYHTYEAVKHDFETWQPKLSDRAIVLFHDTNVLEADFGVQRLFREVSEDRRSFEFSHGYGLGVVAMGERVPDTINLLFELSSDPLSRSLLRGVFSRLGEACAHDQAKRHLQQAIKTIKTSTATKELDFEDRLSALATARDELRKERSNISGQLYAALSRESEALVLVSSSNREIDRLKEMVVDVKNLSNSKIAAMTEDLRAAKSEHAEAVENLAAAAERAAYVLERCTRAEGRASSLEMRVADLDFQVARLSAANAVLSENVETLAKADGRNQDEILRLHAEADNLRSSSDRLVEFSEHCAQRVGFLEARAKEMETRLTRALRAESKALRHFDRHTREMSIITALLAKAEAEAAVVSRAVARLTEDVALARRHVAEMKATPLRRLIKSRLISRTKKITGRLAGQLSRLRRVLRKRYRMLTSRRVLIG